ncbi:polyprenyl synthetase family protein [Occultella kanbiaonis]|uniref:polyprenyl synthetase family protein n=1 Tax=Occultella kanbiaonis TaxID=2675754 RepID=UPI00143DB6D2|nr:polyprenyl synthetase family protein [Occultella kanbiaonis]
MNPTDRDLERDAVLQDFIDRGTASSGPLGGPYQQLWSDLAGATSGGKRFRPALLVGVYQAHGGTDRHMAATVAAGVELLHTAFVIHDDVIDGDQTRRGLPNVSGAAAGRARAAGVDKAHANAYAQTAGILAGDLALVGAVRTVALCGAPPATVSRVLDLVDQAVHASAAGELADVGLSVGIGSATLGEVLTMAELKTAVYSFVLPLQAGAILAGAAAPVVDRLGELGRLVGIAFQLQDDVLGVFGDEEQTGKSCLSDLREAKQTPLIAHARTTAQWPSIAPFHGKADLTQEQADRACALLEECGSRQFIEDLAHSYLEAALVIADEIGLPREFLGWVSTLTKGLLRSAA